MTVAGLRIDPIPPERLADQVLSWCRARSSGIVCIASVHLVMESRDDAGLARLMREADVILPGGAPLVWLMKRRLLFEAAKAYGPWLMSDIVNRAHADHLSIALLGSTEEVLHRVEIAFRWRYPGLKICAKIAPRFGALSEQSEREIASQLKASGARIVFVGLGCPRQERFMLKMKREVDAVFVGVGAAFEYHAGLSRRAPQWVQRAELEWLYKFLHDPVRLARRYLWHIPRFIGIVALEELSRRTTKRPVVCSPDHGYE